MGRTVNSPPGDGVGGLSLSDITPAALNPTQGPIPGAFDHRFHVNGPLGVANEGTIICQSYSVGSAYDGNNYENQHGWYVRNGEAKTAASVVGGDGGGVVTHISDDGKRIATRRHYRIGDDIPGDFWGNWVKERAGTDHSVINITENPATFKLIPKDFLGDPNVDHWDNVVMSTEGRYLMLLGETTSSQPVQKFYDLVTETTYAHAVSAILYHTSYGTNTRFWTSLVGEIGERPNRLQFVLGAGGVGSDPSHLAAGGRPNDTAHEKQLTIRDTGEDPDIDYTLKFTGPGTDGLRPVVKVDGQTINEGQEVPFTGDHDILVRSGDRTGEVTLTCTSVDGTVTQKLKIVGTICDVDEPAPLTDCPSDETPFSRSVFARVKSGEQFLEGHVVRVTAELVEPPDATVDISPDTITSAGGDPRSVTVSSTTARSFSLRFTDETLDQGSRTDSAVDFSCTGQETVKTCVLQGPASEAATSGVPNTEPSITGREQGGAVAPSSSTKASGFQGCKADGVCTECQGKGLCSDGVADPVLLGTGQFAEFHTEIGWRTPGGRLIFQRFYLSGRRQAGDLGVGWAHNFSHRILDRGSVGVILYDPVGNRTSFEADGAGGYRPLAAGGVSLSRATSGGWSLRYEAGTEYRFDAGGRLISVSDNNANTFTLSYASSGDLTRIEDGVGGAFELEVTDGLIRTLTAKNGDRIQFAYSPDRRLTVATDVIGRATVYGYDSSSGLLTHIQRPITGIQGVTNDIVYDAKRRAVEVRQTTGDGQVSSSRIEYPDATTRRVIDPTGQTFTFRLDEIGNIAERVDPNGDTYRLTRDAAGRPLTRTDPAGKVETWAYDAAGRIESYTAPGGEVTRVERDAAGVPVALIHPDNTREERQFDAAGNLVRTKDALGRETIYTRNARGQVTSVQEPGGATTLTEYDASGDVSRVVDAAGRETTYQRDAMGREIAVTTPGGRTSRTEYCQCGSVSATIDAAGNRTTYTYDALGSLLTTTLPNGATTEYTYLRRFGRDLVSEVKDALGNISKTEYDASGRVTASVDAQGRRTTFVFDTQGRITRVNSPGGAFTLTRYNTAGLVAETENARGAVTAYVYDTNNRLIRTILPDGSASSQEYDTNGRVVKRTAADGAVVQSIHDANGRVIATIDPLGHISRTEYGSSGVVTRTINARDKATNYEHDALDRVTRTVNAAGFATRQEYSSAGDVTLTENARGAQTTFLFDVLGRVTESTDPLGGKVKKSYDAVGNVVRVEDERGKAWTFAFDLLGRKTLETDPAGRATAYTFDIHELKKVRHADGAEWRFAYDAAGRLSTRTLVKPSGVVEDTESFFYDIVGNRTRAENAAVIILSEYDSMDRETKRTTTWRRTGAVRELLFTYDAVGRRQVLRDSHGRLTTYAYDKDSRLIELKVLEPNPNSTNVADAFRARTYTFNWDAGNNLTSLEYPNGTRTRREYDDIDRLTRLVHERATPTGPMAIQASWLISRDAVGNPTSVVRQDGDTWSLQHDLKDQLTRVVLPQNLVTRMRLQSPTLYDAPGDCHHAGDDADAPARLLRAGEVTYQYDAAGNRTGETYGSQSVQSTYGPVNELLARGTTSYTYDLRGNQVERRFQSGHKHAFAYSAAGKLTTFSSGHTQPFLFQYPVRQLERYASAPGGERVLNEDLRTGRLTHSLWDGHRQIDEWYEQTALITGKQDKGRLFTRGLGGELLDDARYTRGTGGTLHCILAQLDCDDWDNLLEWLTGGPDFKLGHVRFSQPDFLGSTSLVSNHKGAPLDRLSYGPWGETLEGNFARARFGYTGHQFEARTGHWGSLHRYLDPRAGRWTQRDPIGARGGRNRYRYAAGAPFLNIDRRGTTITPISGGGVKNDIKLIRDAIGLLNRVSATRAEVDFLSKPCIELTVQLSSKRSPYSAQPLAETNQPADSRAQFRRCCSNPGVVPPTKMTTVIYMGEKGLHPGHAGEPSKQGEPSLIDAKYWIAIRLAHEFWHASKFSPGENAVDGYTPEQVAFGFWEAFQNLPEEGEEDEE